MGTELEVSIHRNRVKKCWSLKHKGKVIAHPKRYTLKECEFRVGKKSRERVLRTGIRNVHAYVRGLTLTRKLDKLSDWICVRYDPFEKDYFYIRETGERIEKAEFVRFDSDGTVWVQLCQKYEKFQ